ncbi:MaoC family dehydratase N-terminal domain-containing protein [soil metagenome]
MSVSIGMVIDRVTFDVERGKIREFAIATFASDAIHTDPEVASSAGYTDVLATATHVVVAGHQRNPREFLHVLGLEHSRVVVGSVSWEYERPLVAGDTLEGTRRVASDEITEGRRGNSMRLVTLETEFKDDHGRIAVTQREVLIERGRA